MSDVVIVGLSFFGGCTVVALVFFAIAYLRRWMITGWTRTNGVVIDRRTGHTNGGMPALHPTFRWQDQHGETHQRTSQMQQSFGPRPGTAVVVYYDPAAPERAIIYSFAQSGQIFWLLGGAVLILGVLVGGFLLMVAARM